MSTAEDLKNAITELHARLDSWHAVVEGVAVEAGDDPTEALADPRLEAAQDAFYAALGVFEAATLPVLGMIVLDDEDSDVADVLEDDFFMHLVVGVSDNDLPERLGEALGLIGSAGAELSARLQSAGFTVKHLSASRGELELDDTDVDGFDEDGRE